MLRYPKNAAQPKRNAVQPKPLSLVGEYVLHKAGVSLLDDLLGFWRRLTLPDGMRVPIIHDQAREGDLTLLSLCYSTQVNAVEPEGDAVQAELTRFIGEHLLYKAKISILGALLTLSLPRLIVNNGHAHLIAQPALTLSALSYGTRNDNVQLEIKAVQAEPMSFTGETSLYTTISSSSTLFQGSGTG